MYEGSNNDRKWGGNGRRRHNELLIAVVMTTCDWSLGDLKHQYSRVLRLEHREFPWLWICAISSGQYLVQGVGLTGVDGEGYAQQRRSMCYCVTARHNIRHPSDLWSTPTSYSPITHRPLTNDLIGYQNYGLPVPRTSASLRDMCKHSCSSWALFRDKNRCFMSNLWCYCCWGLRGLDRACSAYSTTIGGQAFTLLLIGPSQGTPGLAELLQTHTICWVWLGGMKFYSVAAMVFGMPYKMSPERIHCQQFHQSE